MILYFYSTAKIFSIVYFYGSFVVCLKTQWFLCNNCCSDWRNLRYFYYNDSYAWRSNDWEGGF